MSVSNIPGANFRIRHDTVKTVLNSFMMTSPIRAECEVYGLFKDLIPVRALEQVTGVGSDWTTCDMD